MADATTLQSMPLNVIRFDKVQNLIREVIGNPLDFGCVGLCGEPGIGKTQIIEDTAAKLKKGLSYVNCTLVSPGDLLGAAFPSSDRKYTEFLPSRILDENNVIFFDEIANGSNEVLNLANRTLLSGELNGRRFKEARLFAYNPTTVSEMAQELPTILVNKAAIFVVDYTSEDFLRYALGDGHKKIHPGVAAFIAETGERYMRVKDYHPLKREGVALPTPGSPFPSPRALELFSSLYKRVEMGSIDMTSYEVAYATLGAEAGKKLADYLVCSKYLCSTQKILAGNEEKFPEEAFVDGALMTPIMYMQLYNLLASINDKRGMENAAKWVFTQTKQEIMGTETLKVFATALQESRFKDSFASVVGGVGKEILGEKQFSQFMIGAITRDLNAAKF
jgi:hypothetical protein